MNYSIEKRDDSYYAITDQYYNSKKIIVNLRSIIKTCDCSLISLKKTPKYTVSSSKLLDYSPDVDCTVGIDYNMGISKKLEYIVGIDYVDEKLKLVLIINNQHFYRTTLDMDIFLAECVKSLKSNNHIKNNEYILKAEHELIQQAFVNILYKNKCILASENVINCYAEILVNGKTYATSPAINFTNDNLTFFECAMKKNIGDISTNSNSDCNIIVHFDTPFTDDDSLNKNKYLVLELNAKKNTFSVSLPYFKYLQFSWQSINYIETSDKKEIKCIDILNKPYYCNGYVDDKEKEIVERHKYIIKHNSQQEIMEFIESYKQTSIVIDINQYMVQEFNK